MWTDVRAAFLFLTILPLGASEGRQPGWSMAWYPLVGGCLGGVLALIALLAPGAPGVTAFLVLLAWVVLTGGLHLDGFGDSCDGLFATVEPARRLEIMRDPRSGSWAVVGLGMLLLGKWVTIQTVAPALLVLPPIIGRWVMVLAAYHFSYARASGLGRYYRDGLGKQQLLGASLLALLGTTLAARALGPVLLVFGVGLLSAWGGGRWAARRLGGLTGDVYGALCELSELLCLGGLGGLWPNG